MVGHAPRCWRGVALAAGRSTGASALAAGLILAMSSTAIVLQSLEEKGLRQGPVGQAAFGVLLFQDLAVIPLFALLPLLACGRGTPRRRGHGASLLAGLPDWARIAGDPGAPSAAWWSAAAT